jgi:MFS superfamily sulfate permease-like transporter
MPSPQATNIEAGMAIGVMMAIVAFVISYANMPAVMNPRVRHRCGP